MKAPIQAPEQQYSNIANVIWTLLHSWIKKGSSVQIETSMFVRSQCVNICFGLVLFLMTSSFTGNLEIHWVPFQSHSSPILMDELHTLKTSWVSFWSKEDLVTHLNLPKNLSAKFLTDDIVSQRVSIPVVEQMQYQMKSFTVAKSGIGYPSCKHCSLLILSSSDNHIR